MFAPWEDGQHALEKKMPHTDEEWIALQADLESVQKDRDAYQRQWDTANATIEKLESQSWMSLVKRGVAYLAGNHKVDALGLLTAGTALYFALFPSTPAPQPAEQPPVVITKEAPKLDLQKLAETVQAASHKGTLDAIKGTPTKEK